MHNLGDFDWCCERILSLIESLSDHQGAWEEVLIESLVSSKRNSRAWSSRAPLERHYYSGIAVQHLIDTKRVHVVPGSVQATGRRRLQITNILDSIVQSI